MQALHLTEARTRSQTTSWDHIVLPESLQMLIMKSGTPVSRKIHKPIPINKKPTYNDCHAVHPPSSNFHYFLLTHSPLLHLPPWRTALLAALGRRIIGSPVTLLVATPPHQERCTFCFFIGFFIGVPRSSLRPYITLEGAHLGTWVGPS